MQIVAFRARHANRLALNGSLHFQFAVFDEALNFFRRFTLDAVAHLDHLLDLVAANFLHITAVQEAHIDFALGQFVAQNVFHLRELKLSIAKHGDFFVLQLNGG